MTVTITSISALNGGAEVSVSVRLSEGENFEKRQLLLLSRQYAELRPEKGEIDIESFERLLAESEVCAAVKRGMNILGYGACSEKNMTLKLRSKGFSRETAQRAAEYLCELGYINEREDARREAERCVKKYWGRKRIAAALYEKGYSEGAVSRALEALDEYDFSKICAELIKRKFKSVPEDRDEQRKLFASLLRYGYSSSEIKNAFEMVK